MLNLNNAAKSLPEAFKIEDDKRLHKVLDMFYFLHNCILDDNKSVSWAIMRVWIDETITDNERAYLIFSLGRIYETKILEKEEE